jgi:hypothetical protein
MAPKSLTLHDIRLFQALNKVMAELFEHRVVLNGIASVKKRHSAYVAILARVATYARVYIDADAITRRPALMFTRPTSAHGRQAPIFRGLALNSHALRTSMRRIVEGIMSATRIDGADIDSHTYSESPPPGRPAIGS